MEETFEFCGFSKTPRRFQRPSVHRAFIGKANRRQLFEAAAASTS